MKPKAQTVDLTIGRLLLEFDARLAEERGTFEDGLGIGVYFAITAAEHMEMPKEDLVRLIGDAYDAMKKRTAN